MLKATLPELVQNINSVAAKVNTLNATVDIATKTGGAKKGKITEYQEIRGYVLLRKPSTLRMIGLFPVVRNRLFDMVSTGENFRLSLPTQNKFIVGTSELPHHAKESSLENVRPQHVLDALLVREIPPNDIAVLESGMETVRDTKTNKVADQADYIVAVIQQQPDKTWALSRKIIFSRADLRPRKQILYDKLGNIMTIASYENYGNYKGIMFPNIIQIERPMEEYSIQLAIVKLTLNEALKDDQFALAQPPGSQLVRLDNEAQSSDPKSDSPSPSHAR